MQKKPKDCPLFLHRNGQWCKKIKGKQHYFGTDLDAALVRWVDEKDYLLAGRPIPKKDGKPTIEELGNLYHAAGVVRVSSGEITQRSLDDTTKSINRLIEIVGGKCKPETLEPLDFARIKQALFEPVERTTAIRGGVKGNSVERRSPVTVGNDVRRLRTFLNWCSDSNLIAPCRWAKEFGVITSKQARVARAKSGRSLLVPADLRNVIDTASLGLKPIILLGINAGMGSTDIANFLFEDLPDLDAKEVWIDTNRCKTGAPRRFVLWPETQEAIRDWIKHRPSPCSDIADRLFWTSHGVAWVRDSMDSISKAFLQTRRAAGVETGTFYDLRRAFQTVGAETLEYRAVSFVMGHTVSEKDMSGRYTVAIPDKAIRKVCNHVRSWLFAAKVQP